MLDEQKVFGSLLGLILGDALGAKFEGVPRDHLASTFENSAEVLNVAIERESLRYTDDGQMALALARSQ